MNPPTKRGRAQYGWFFDLYNPTEEHAQLRRMVRQFAERDIAPQAETADAEESFNMSLFRQLGELGLLGITADPEFGGSGMDAIAAVIAHEEISAADPGFCLSYLAHALLFVNNLSQNGSAAQKAKYLPDVCSGKTIGGMCMSEPDAGTDVLGMRTSAKQDGDNYILNGNKMWITNGAIDKNELGDVFFWYTPGKKDRGATNFPCLLSKKDSRASNLDS